MIDGGPLPPCLIISNLKDALLTVNERSFTDFDLWFQQGSSGMSRVAAGSVPGRAPGDWYQSKYTPAPVEWLLIQRNVPVGDFADFQFLYPVNTDPVRSIELSRNEIEAVLVQGDLSRAAVDHAMGLLPDLTLFYNYLETKGEIKTLNQVRLLLSY